MRVTSPPGLLRSDEPLRITGLTVTRGTADALSGIDLHVSAGEVVAVAGEPGSGKTTLVRCVAGDLAATRGQIRLCGKPLATDTTVPERHDVGVVWQELALCDNLDVASNLLLGRESRRLMLSESRFHAAAATELDGLNLPIGETTQLTGSLSAAQRQLLAIARAVSRQPRLLVLDEPTESLGSLETEKVEELIARLRADGTAILLVSRDSKQILRLAQRILVLRRGRMVAELDPRETHSDDLAALLSGQTVNSTARRQLTRLHGLAGSLVSAEPSSSLPLIVSALAGALGAERACIHVLREGTLRYAASLGFVPGEVAQWSALPTGIEGGPAGRAAEAGERVVEAGCWSVPVRDGDGVTGVISVFPESAGDPQRDELDLLTLYAGYAAGAIERDRLLDQVTARNRILETIREMLEALTGPVPVGEGLQAALAALRGGLRASEVALLTHGRDGPPEWRGFSGPTGADPAGASRRLQRAAVQTLSQDGHDGAARDVTGRRIGRIIAVGFQAPEAAAVLLADWPELTVTREERALMENAAHSLRLALEREEAAVAHQEAAALRRSQEMQQDFLSRLSHELRTPLTAIRGYASSLLQTDVTWDRASRERFLARISAESARMGRLVGDLLDFSAIESGVMRLQRDWCDIALVAEAAIACLPADGAAAISVRCESRLPPIWADHDRLEQVFVNLVGNALRHNPGGTRITVAAALADREDAEPQWGKNGTRAPAVEITIADNGTGLPDDLVQAPFDAPRRERTRSSGAGLGLSIAKGIIEAHDGSIELMPVTAGTAFRLRLPVEAAEAAGGVDQAGTNVA